jgi:pyruvate formate lyase activating enzyme
MDKLLKYADLVLLDIKIMDVARHHEATGKDNCLILANARKVARLKPMRVRVPIIPGFNDSPEEVREIARFARDELGLVNIDLLPYNKMGERKYECLDRSYTPLEAKDESHMQALKSAASSEAGLSH